MRRSLQIFSIVFISLFILNCSSQNVKNDENLGEVEKPADPGKKVGSMDMRAVDESIETRWVETIPENEDLETLTGKVGISGNEPFTFYVLYVDDQTGYALRGNQKLFNFLRSREGIITVAGEITMQGKQKWINVLYIIKRGEKK